VIACVGPCQTEIASTTGTTSATITTHERTSKKPRNAHPAKTAAHSLAKFPGRPQSSTAKRNASSARTPVVTSSHEQQRRRHHRDRHDRDGRPEADVRQVRRGDEPADDADGEDAERRPAPPAQ
jgi:hypothetical protein